MWFPVENKIYKIQLKIHPVDVLWINHYYVIIIIIIIIVI